jgi:hypothetical protein
MLCLTALLFLAVFLLPSLSCDPSLCGHVDRVRYHDVRAYDHAWSVTATSDLGFAAAGYVARSPGDGDGYVLKTNAGGRRHWDHTLDLGRNVEAKAVTETTDGSLVYVGSLTLEEPSRFSRMLVVALGPDGSPAWQDTYPATHCVRGEAVCPCPDGGVLVSGRSDYAEDSTENGLFLARYRADGSLDWTRVYTRPFDRGTDVVALPGGGYGVLSDRSGHVRIMRLGAGGDTLWTREYEEEKLSSTLSTMCAAPDRGFLLARQVAVGNHAGSNAKLVRVGPDGAVMWTLVLDRSRDDRIYGLAGTQDGGFVAAGCTGQDIDWAWEYDPYVASVSAEGELLWDEALDSGGWSVLHAVACGSGGRALAAGSGNCSKTENYDILLVGIRP